MTAMQKRSRGRMGQDGVSESLQKLKRPMEWGGRDKERERERGGGREGKRERDAFDIPARISLCDSPQSEVKNWKTE